MCFERCLRSSLVVVMMAVAVMSTPGLGANELERTVFLVPTTEQPHWRDMAYLTAIPASTVANRSGGPAVITLGEYGVVTREVRDYLARYKPDRVIYMPPVSAQLPRPIIAHYGFDDRSGLRAADDAPLSEFPLTASLQDVDPRHDSVPGAIGRALRIHGSAKRIYFPNDPKLALTRNFTITFWMKSYDTKQAGPYLLTIHPDEGQRGLLYRKGAIESIGASPGRIPVTDEQWHHYAFVNDGKTWHGYRDGEPVFESPGFTLEQKEPSPWVVNKFGSLDVALDDLRFYPEPLPVGEIEQVMRGQTLVGNDTTQPPIGAVTLAGRSAEETSYHLATQFWDRCATVVLCASNDYKSALVASCLAARLEAPLLLFDPARGLATETTRLIERLGAKEAIAVGVAPKASGLRIEMRTLADGDEALAWMTKRGIEVNYIALANPNDRDKAWPASGQGVIEIHKTSLAAPLLAAGRSGAVALLDEPDVQFKRALYTDRETSEPVAGAKPVEYRFDPTWTMARIGKIFSFSDAAPKTADTFVHPYHPVNGRYGNARLMSHFTAAETRLTGNFAPVWLFASKRGADRYDRIAIDLDRDGAFADSEVFGAGDTFVVPTLNRGERRYLLSKIGGNGEGDGADSAHFSIKYLNWFAGELVDDSRRFAMLPASHVAFWNTYHYTEAVIDTDGDGELGDEALTFSTGDSVTLDGRAYDVSVSSDLEGTNRDGKAEALYLTYPSRGAMNKRMRRIAQLIGHPPELLCIVALPSAIPYGAEPTGLAYPADVLSDAHWGQLDDDGFLEVGIGRFFGENHAFTTLAAARSVTYEQLINPAWADRALSLGWAPRGLNTMLQLDNVGMSYRMIDTGQYISSPGDKHDNLKDVAIVWHAQHSDASSLGGGPSWGMQTLIAPATITSGGCMALAVDWFPPPYNAPCRWMRNGGIAFLGGTRQNGAQHTRFDYPFWQKAISGQTLGSAYRSAINSVRAEFLIEHGPDALNEPTYENFAMLGDPGLTLHVPGSPRVAPAHVTAKGDRVVVHPPAAYWDVESFIEQTGRKRTTHYRSGPGLVPTWPMIEGYRMKASYRAPRGVVGFERADGTAAPYVVDDHPDGTASVYWQVDVAPGTGDVEYRVRLAPER